MADPKHKLDREEIMSFLLGELEEAETSRIEAMFLSDPTYSEEIEAAKSQLYQEYESGSLSPRQSGRFEARFLPNLDEDKKKFQAMLDRNEAKRLAGLDGFPTPPPPAAPVAPAPSPIARPPVPEPAKRSNVPMVGGILALAIAGLCVAFFLRGDAEKSEQSAEAVALPVFSVRGKSQVVVLPKRDKIRLHLPLPSDESSTAFAITAYHGDNHSSWPAQLAGAVVETTVDKATLEEGRYDLELLRDDGTVVGYYSLQK